MARPAARRRLLTSQPSDGWRPGGRPPPRSPRPALRTRRIIVRVPPEWLPWPATLEHYGEVLFSSSRTARSGRAFLNSTVVSLGTVVIVVLASAMAAYPLARMRFRGRDLDDARVSS